MVLVGVYENYSYRTVDCKVGLIQLFENNATTQGLCFVDIYVHFASACLVLFAIFSILIVWKQLHVQACALSRTACLKKGAFQGTRVELRAALKAVNLCVRAT